MIPSLKSQKCTRTKEEPMKHEVKTKLKAYAEKVAEILSDPKQNKANTAKEIFYTESVEPLSEDTAAIIYRKRPSRLKAAVFTWYANDQWWRIVATDGHITGMLIFPLLKIRMERDNYELTHGQKA